MKNQPQSLAHSDNVEIHFVSTNPQTEQLVK